MTTFSFSLLQYAADAKRRYELVCEHADDLGGHPAIVPQGWTKRPVFWLEELQRRYWNMADFYGWPELPGYDGEAVKRFLTAAAE